MRIERYTDELLDLAYDTKTIRYYREPEKDEKFGKLMVQELVFFNEYMLLHVSDEDGEEYPLYPCSKLWFNDILVYDFDCDNNVLTMSFVMRPDIKIYANPTQMQEIYKIISIMDDKFITADFNETNDVFEETLKIS